MWNVHALRIACIYLPATFHRWGSERIISMIGWCDVAMQPQYMSDSNRLLAMLDNVLRKSNSLIAAIKSWWKRTSNIPIVSCHWQLSSHAPAQLDLTISPMYPMIGAHVSLSGACGWSSRRLLSPENPATGEHISHSSASLTGMEVWRDGHPGSN